MLLDAHQHYWRVDRGDYPWMASAHEALRRDYLPEDLAPLLRKGGVTRTIAVQSAPTEAETDFLLELSERTDSLAGVVGWLDLDDDGFATRLDRRREHAGFVGLRALLDAPGALDRPGRLEDDDWIRRPRVLDSLAYMAETEVPLDVAGAPRHLPFVVEALERTPGLRVVIDHLSRPAIASGELDPWREWMVQLSNFDDVHCKLSGLVTQADPELWTPEDLRPYVEHVLELFGPERLMFGSDWPHCTLAGEYGEVLNALRALIGPALDEDETDDVFGLNAAVFYDVSIG